MRILLFFTLAWSTVAFAQTKTNKVRITYGHENDSKRSTVLGIFGYNDSGYYTLRTQKKDIMVEHLNNSMEVDQSVPMEKLTKEKSELDFYSSVQMEHNLYLFFTLFDSKENKMTLFAKVLNQSTLLTQGELIELGTTTYASRRSFLQNQELGVYSAFSMVTCEDKSQLLLITREMSKGEDDEMSTTEVSMTLSVFDSNLKKSWTNNAMLGFSNELFNVTNITLDDDGNVSILGVEYKENIKARASKRSGMPSYTYHLFRYEDLGNSKTEFPIELTGRFITDLKVKTAPNGDVIVAGFFADKGSFNIRGAFYMIIDPGTESIKLEKATEFGPEFITINLTNREGKNATKKEKRDEESELNDFDMRQLLLHTNGGATLIAEQIIFYTLTTTYSNGGGQQLATNHYLYNDIIAISFDAAGNLLWKTKIPKRQHTISDGGFHSSYALSVVGDKLFFVFNDNPKNFLLSKDEVPYNFSASDELAVVIVEVNNQGTATKELLFTTDHSESMLRPKIAEQTGEKEMIICGERPQIFQYCKLTFK